MTINEFKKSNKLHITPAGIQKRLSRNGHKSVGIDEPISPEIEQILKDWYLKNKPSPPISPPPKKQVHNGVKIKERISIREILALAPLPMLGLAASYGVYFFATNFAPDWVAVVEASSFELIYIGLASLKGLTDDQLKKATRISIGAVFVSITYNTVAGAIHQTPELLDQLHPVWFWTISVLHGAPLALLGYLLADLILHR